MKLYLHQQKLLTKNPRYHGLFWEVGCLAGDTKIKYNRGGNTKTTTIAQLYKKLKESSRIDLSIPTKVQSLVDGEVRLNTLADIVYSGKKQVYTIELENGYNLQATGDHKIYTSKGWRKLSSLRIGSLVATNDTPALGKKKKKKNYQPVDNLWHHPYASRYDMPRNDRKNKIYHHAVKEKHVLVYEAELNLYSYDEYIKILRTDEVTAKFLRYVDPTKYHIHHKDHNHKNNEVSNLEKLPKYEHLKLHGKDAYSHFPNTTITYKKVIKKAFVKGKVIPTYDIACHAPNNNYIANGIVVHNTGKTLTAIKLAEKNVKSCLIVCPKSLVENWRRELETWSSKINQIEWLIVTKEQFRKNWQKLRFRNQGIIIDEIHHFAGYKSQMHKSAVKWMGRNKPKCVYLLTGTPYLSTPYNIMCYEKLLGRIVKWQDYKKRFFNDVRMGSRIIPQVKSGIEDEIAKIVWGIGSTVGKKQCLDLPDQVFLREDFELTKGQRDKVKDLENDATTSNHITFWTRRHQICGGTLKKEKGLDLFQSEKTKWVQDFSKRYTNFVVVCRYNAELEMLNGLIPGSHILNGATKKRDRQKIIDKVNYETHSILLVNAAISEGYNLTGVDKMVFYSNSFSHKDRVQMIGRIHRIGQKKKCTYWDLVVKDTVDEDVLKALIKKEDFHISIYKKDEKIKS